MRALLSAVVLSLLVVGCKKPPVAGAACKPSERGARVCAAKDLALECRDGAWLAVPCRGPAGCNASKPDDPRGPSQTATCDERVAKEGDACANIERDAEKDHACAVDGSSTLVCDRGLWVKARPCRGPKGCKNDPTLECDTSIANAGDPCVTYPRQRDVCSVDRKSLLECKDKDKSAAKPKGASAGFFVVRATCPTSVGCESAGLDGDPTLPIPVCRFAGAKVGDPCGEGNDFRLACNADRTLLLKCDPETKTFLLATTCGPKEKCTSPGGHSRCGP